MRLPLPQFGVRDSSDYHIGEVIETGTTEFLAQCLEPEDLSFPVMPPFGSWVKSVDEESGNQIMAIVYHATTTPIDSVHRAVALGLSLAELREQQPQIFAMLKTEFRAVIVGFIPSDGRGNRLTDTKLGSSEIGNGNQIASELQPFYPTDKSRVYQYLPPRPPQIHQGVYQCQPPEIIHFTEKLDFLRTLLQVNDAPIEALTAAAIRAVYQIRKADRNWLVQAGRTLSMLLKDDYDRLRYILSQIHA